MDHIHISIHRNVKKCFLATHPLSTEETIETLPLTFEHSKNAHNYLKLIILELKTGHRTLYIAVKSRYFRLKYNLKITLKVF